MNRRTDKIVRLVNNIMEETEYLYPCRGTTYPSVIQSLLFTVFQCEYDERLSEEENIKKASDVLDMLCMADYENTYVHHNRMGRWIKRSGKKKKDPMIERYYWKYRETAIKANCYNCGTPFDAGCCLLEYVGKYKVKSS